MIIQADLHTHTVASTHAYSTITENCRYAAEIGLKAIAMTDHGEMMPDSPHFWHFENLHILPREIFGVTVLKGIEANIINYKGELDATEKTLSRLEWVVASYHKYYMENFVPADSKTVTDGYISSMDTGKVDMLGHPTVGAFQSDWERLVPAAKERGVILELNESSIKTGKSPVKNAGDMLKACKKYGCKIAVNTDAHFWSVIAKTPLCGKILEELDFPADLVINSDWDMMREYILARHPELDI